MIGTAGGAAGAVLRYVPLMRHTYRSEVNISKLPVRTEGLAAGPSAARFIEVMVKNAQGELIEIRHSQGFHYQGCKLFGGRLRR